MDFSKPRVNLLGLMVLTTVIALYPAGVEADQLNALADWGWTYTDNETQNKKTGEVTQTEASILSKLYNLSLSKELYPNLNLKTGGVLGTENLQSEGTELSSESEQVAKSHFLQLGLNNPLLKVDTAYNKNETRSSINSIATNPQFQERLSGGLSWTPVDLPSFDLSFSQSSAYQQPKTDETLAQNLNLATGYQYQSFVFDYAHGQSESEQISTANEQHTKTIGTSDSVGLGYAHKAFDNQLALTMNSRLHKNSYDTSGSRIRALPVSGGTPFYIEDDDDPTENSPEQIVSSYGPDEYVDIGTGNRVDRVSIGLAFDTAKSVNSINLIPLVNFEDSQLASPLEISRAANDIGFEVYTSNDQLSWIQQTITSRPYDEFRNFFEIDFVAPEVKFRYLKIAIRPLAIGVSRQIRITAPQVFFKEVLANEQDNRGESLDQSYDLGLRWRISDQTSAFWNVGYGVSEITDPSSSSTEEQMSTNLGLRHRFDPVFSTSTSASRYVSIDHANDTRAASNSISSVLRADYFEAFQQTFGVSYSESVQKQGVSSGESLYLRNRAQLYTNWSMNADVTVGRSTSNEGTKGQSTTYRLSTSVAPNPQLHGSLGLLYSQSAQDNRADKSTISGQAQTSWVPSTTLSLNASWNMTNQERDGVSRAVRQSYTISWSPLLDGALSYSLGYNKELDNLGIGADVWAQELRWKVANGMMFSLSYSDADVETKSEYLYSRTLTASFRVYL